MPRLVVVLVILLLASTLVAAGKPNIVVILADDLGYNELSCQGATDLPTPFIDSIASNGVRFTSGYVSAPVCCPSRAGLLTGRYQTRFGHELNAIGVQNFDEHVGLPLSVRTMADRLKELDYATGLVGKWHLGAHPSRHPLERGFDEFYGFLNEGHFYLPKPYLGAVTWLRIAKSPASGGGPLARGRFLFSDHMGNGLDEPDYDLDNPILRGREPIVETEYLTDALAREAVDFIERHKQRPFFLFLSLNAPHSPMQAADAYMNRFPDIGDVHRRIFVAMVANLDDAVGRVLSKLDTEGLTDNTLLFFLSDNGGPTRELTSSNFPLRGGKGQVHEGGVRVPFLIQWKGRIPGGLIDRRPVIALDILPTALAAAGAEKPADELDGVDLLPYVAGNEAGLPHQTIYWRYGSRMAVRHGDWKLVGQYDSSSVARNLELYSLSADLGETRNRAGGQPDIVEELQRIFESYDGGMIPPLWGADPRSRPTRTNIPLELLSPE